jgi:hypothetical protein
VAGDQSARPLSLRQAAGRAAQSAGLAAGIIDKHHQFWGGEENMTEGNPMLILERGERSRCRRRSGTRAAATSCTTTRTRISRRRHRGAALRANYKKAGGNIELHYFESDRQPGHSPDLTKIGDTFEKMLAFIGKHLK